MKTAPIPSDEKLLELKSSLEQILLAPDLDPRERAAAERMRRLLEWELMDGQLPTRAGDQRVESYVGTALAPAI